MSRRVKQLVYGLLYIIVLGSIVTGIYFLFLKPAPSCFDGIQNEGEQGVDCGGPCAKICIPANIQSISALGPVQVFSPLAGHATVLVQVENANANFAASSFDYTVTLYGADGSSTVATLPGSSFAYADETKYIVFPNVSVSAPVSRADIAISNIQWVPTDQMGFIPQFSFTNLEDTASGNGYVTVTGNITDRDVASFNKVLVMAIFKNTAGAPIGASQTELDSIAPGVTQDFSISYPTLPNENISATEFKAYAARE
jgi:hypothetical protein